MSPGFRKAYSVLGLLLLLEILIQFYYIAAAIFTIAAKPDRTTAEVMLGAVHGAEGFLGAYPLIWDPLVFLNGILAIPITVVILIGLSFGARYPWRTTGLTAMLFLVLVFDWAIGLGLFGAPNFRGDCVAALCEPTKADLPGQTVVALLGYVNALTLTGLGIYLVVRNWAFRRHAGPVAAVRTTSDKRG